MRRLLIIVILIILAFFFFTDDAKAGRKDQILRNIIEKCSKIWDELEVIQAEIHLVAEEARMALCADGVIEYCEEEVQEIRKRSILEKEKPILTGHTYRITVTHYGANVAETDFSPCIGASNENICDLHDRGIKVIALSQDLIGYFKYGDQVWLEHDDLRCTGQFTVMDTMNPRFYYRGDIFSPEEEFGKCHNVQMRKVK